MMLPDNSPVKEAPVATVPERDASAPSYSPAYSNKKPSDPLNVGGAWRWLTGTERPGGGNDKTAELVVNENRPNAQVAHVDVHHRAAVTPMAIVPPTPAVEGQMPAWRWYGYGAPVPGSNPYAPEGVYGQVNPGWYFQSGATPGAIPGPSVPVAPAMPLLPSELPHPSPAQPGEPAQPSPTTAEPPRLMTLPMRERGGVKQASAIDLPAQTEQQPATIDLPVPHVSEQPLTAAPAAPVIRGQSPEPAVPEKLLVSLRLACIGYATQVELTPKDEMRIALRLSMARGMSADRLAERIVQLPELSGYDIEMQFDR